MAPTGASGRERFSRAAKSGSKEFCVAQRAVTGPLREKRSKPVRDLVAPLHRWSQTIMRSRVHGEVDRCDARHEQAAARRTGRLPVHQAPACASGSDVRSSCVFRTDRLSQDTACSRMAQHRRSRVPVPPSDWADVSGNSPVPTSAPRALCDNKKRGALSFPRSVRPHLAACVHPASGLHQST